jgi:hypothetical protein
MSKQIRRSTVKNVRGWIPLAIGLAWAMPCVSGYATGFLG